MNERFLVEEIYERELLLAEEYERDKETRETLNYIYGAIPITNDS